MSAFSNSSESRRRAAPAACGAILFATLLISAPRMHSDGPPPDTVGVIEGEAINISGPMTVESAHGQIKTVLRSGSDVRVKSGSARIDLVEGGQISICGPAHLSVLKSGVSLTIALDTGAIHVHIEGAPRLTIYTPQIQVQSVSIGDGPQDVLVGFESPGAMCVRANRGAVRLEQQLTGQSVLIPQTGDVLLVNGQLENLRTSAGHCACELQSAKATPAPQTEISQLATAEDLPKKTSEAKPTLPASKVEPAKEEPIYQVFMPPLVYDATAKVQPEIDPRMIIIVRRVRVRPTLIFQGRVEGELVASVAPPPSPASAAKDPSSARKPAPPTTPSFTDRLRTFVRKLWTSGS